MHEHLATYYHERANEYEKVYQIKDEQEDLLTAANYFQKTFAEKSVIEIACGTGYWTEQISKTASSIFSTDINHSLIDIAKKRTYFSPVQFEVADMYKIDTAHKYDGLFAGFIWSHILIQDLDNFILNMSKLITKEGDLVFIDSKQVEGGVHAMENISRIDLYGNTFQTRKLENGKQFEVLKNFPDHSFLINKLEGISTDIRILDLKHYWILHAKNNAFV